MGINASILLSVASGILLVISATHSGIFAWLAFVPIFIAIRKSSLRNAAISGIFFGLTFSFVLFYATTAYGLVYYGVTVFYNTLFVVIAVLSQALLYRRGRGVLYNFFIPPSVWVIFEYLRTIGPVSLPASLGITQYSFLELLQSASIIGTYGISLIVLWVNSAVAAAFLSLSGLEHKTLRQRYGVFFGAITVLVILSSLIIRGHGVLKANPLDTSGIKVSIVKGGLPIELYKKQEYDAGAKQLIRDTYFELTERSLVSEHPEILVWPEGAIYEPVMEIGSSRNRIVDYAREFNCVMLVGAPATGSSAMMTNSAYVISGDGAVLGRRDKQKLIAFIEDYAKGDDSKPVVTTLGKFGILICFDSMYPELARHMTMGGSQILFVLTNYCAFTGSPLTFLHAQDCIMRAVENRRYLVRADQAGECIFVDPFGRIITRDNGKEAGIVNGFVNVRSCETVYTRRGDFVVFMVFLACVLSLFVNRRYSR